MAMGRSGRPGADKHDVFRRRSGLERQSRMATESLTSAKSQRQQVDILVTDISTSSRRFSRH